MAKNYMADVARMLGVELGEEFKIGGSSGIYKFFENGLCYKYDGAWIPAKYQFLDLLIGEVEIVRLPWQPRKDEEYYFPAVGFQYSCSAAWYNSPIDFALKEAGMIFRTEEECEAALPELRKKYLGGDDNV